MIRVQDEGTLLPIESRLNFIGAGVTAVDDPGHGRTNVTIPGGTSPPSFSGDIEILQSASVSVAGGGSGTPNFSHSSGTALFSSYGTAPVAIHEGLYSFCAMLQPGSILTAGHWIQLTLTKGSFNSIAQLVQFSTATFLQANCSMVTYIGAGSSFTSQVQQNDTGHTYGFVVTVYAQLLLKT